MQGYKPCCICPVFFFACVFSLHQCCISVCMFWDSLSRGEPVWQQDIKIHSLTAQLSVLYSCDLFPGNTCLQLAAAKGHEQVVQRLVQVTSCSYWCSVHSGFIRFCFKQNGDWVMRTHVESENKAVSESGCHYWGLFSSRLSLQTATFSSPPLVPTADSLGLWKGWQPAASSFISAVVFCAG